MLRVIVRLVADAALVAFVLFVSAGTVAWWRAWVLAGTMLGVRSIGAIAVYQVNPSLLRERAKLPIHGDQPCSDKLLVFGTIITGFIGLPAVAGADIFRWHLLPRATPVIGAVGLGLFVAGWGLQALALRANAFATTVVRLQHERHHAVADRGVYRAVRHPFYAGTTLVFVGLCLWLQSYAAAICAVAPIALMLIRLRLEERFLHRELPGYREYAARVPHRLLPGIW